MLPSVLCRVSTRLLAFALVLWLGAASGAAAAEEKTIIINFPELLNTRDVNSIPKTVLKKIESVEVGRLSPSEVIDLSDKKHIIDTDGYTRATISMFGFPKATNFSDCTVGVILLPNEESIWRAWREDRVMVLAKDVSARVSSRNKYFDVATEVSIDFPSYMAGFYNTCGTNVELSLFAYLH
jgi:hypothetical protein